MKVKGKKVLSALLIVLMLALAACNSGTVETTSDSGDDSTGEGAKGRFIEDELSLPEEITNENSVRGIRQTGDGSLYLLTDIGIYKSTDNGDNWTKDYQNISIFQDVEKYISSIDMNSNGDIILIYMDKAEMETTDYPEYHYVLINKEGKETAVEFTLPVVSSDSESAYMFNAGDSDGDEADTELGAEDYANTLLKVCLADNGDLFGLGVSSNAVYQIDPLTGEIKHTYEAGADKYIISFTVTENHLIFQGIENLSVYDITSYELVEEGNTLNQMINEKSQAGSISYDSSELQLISEQENSVYYFVNSEGLFRYAMGGTMAEQIINGSLNSMSNPEYYFSSLVKVDDETYLLAANQKLLRYTYSADADAVPSKELKVYALADNQNVRQAISTFQKNNPDIYVNLEIGITGDDAVTISDAIRTLNTNIMAGDGPDIILLDGLPVDSYIEKGLLVDVSDVIKEVSESEGLYDQIVNAYEKEGKVYALPTRFSIPVMLSNQETLDSITNLGTLAETVAKLRKDNPDFSNIINTRSSRSLASELLNIYLNDLQNEDGTINETVLTEFLANAAAIYQNDIAGKDESTISGYEEGAEIEQENLLSGYFTSPVDILESQPKVGLSQIRSISGYMELLGTNKALGGWSYSLASGNEKQGFIPSTTVGINSKTDLMEESKSFIKAMISQEVQKNNLENGFPVNKEAFTTMAGEKEPGTDSGALGVVTSMIDEDGNEVMGEPVMLKLVWPTKEEVAQLETLIETLNAPAMTDQSIKKTVISETTRCMRNEVSVDEAVKNIMQQINIYLSE